MSVALRKAHTAHSRSAAVKKYKQFIVQVHADQEVRYADAKIAVILWESFNWRQGVCYAGFKEVLKRTGLHKVSVYQGLKQLLDRGHIGCVGECRELGHARFRLIVKDRVADSGELSVDNSAGELSVDNTELPVDNTELPVDNTELPVDNSDSPKIAPNDLEPIEESPVGGNLYLNLYTHKQACV
jgi:hypothetical protein